MLSRCSTPETHHQPRICASVDNAREQWRENRQQFPFDEFRVKQWHGLLGSSIFMYLGKLHLCFPVTGADARLHTYFLCSIEFIASLGGRQGSQVLGSETALVGSGEMLGGSKLCAEGEG